jgi:hypothetical protein
MKATIDMMSRTTGRPDTKLKPSGSRRRRRRRSKGGRGFAPRSAIMVSLRKYSQSAGEVAAIRFERSGGSTWRGLAISPLGCGGRGTVSAAPGAASRAGRSSTNATVAGSRGRLRQHGARENFRHTVLSGDACQPPFRPRTYSIPESREMVGKSQRERNDHQRGVGEARCGEGRRASDE